MNKVQKSTVDALVASLKCTFTVLNDSTTTVAAMSLPSGFSVALGTSACVDPKNFNVELGEEFSRGNALPQAVNKLWEMEGYVLATRNQPIHIAERCHETNRAYCEAIGDFSQKPWADAPEEFKNSALQGVLFFLENPDATPETMHANWMKERLAAGWVLGEVKDLEAKTHPCLVDYEFLPKLQRVKDALFINTIRMSK